MTPSSPSRDLVGAQSHRAHVLPGAHKTLSSCRKRQVNPPGDGPLLTTHRVSPGSVLIHLASGGLGSVSLLRSLSVSQTQLCALEGVDPASPRPAPLSRLLPSSETKALQAGPGVTLSKEL